MLASTLASLSQLTCLWPGEAIGSSEALLGTVAGLAALRALHLGCVGGKQAGGLCAAAYRTQLTHLDLSSFVVKTYCEHACAQLRACRRLRRLGAQRVFRNHDLPCA